MGDHGLDVLELERRSGDQAVADRMDDLAHDRDVLGFHRERVERGIDRPLQRIFDRHQSSFDEAVVNGHHRVVDGGKRDQLEVCAMRGGDQRLVGERTLGAEVADAHVPGSAVAALCALRSIAGPSEREPDRFVFLR